MTPTVAALVAAMEAAKPEDDPGAVLDAVLGPDAPLDVALAAYGAALKVRKAMLDREGQMLADLRDLEAALAPYITDQDRPMREAFARWSAAHPEPSP